MSASEEEEIGFVGGISESLSSLLLLSEEGKLGFLGMGGDVFIVSSSTSGLDNLSFLVSCC
jgi:hypothetical protein